MKITKKAAFKISIKQNDGDFFITFRKCSSFSQITDSDF